MLIWCLLLTCVFVWLYGMHPSKLGHTLHVRLRAHFSQREVSYLDIPLLQCSYDCQLGCEYTMNLQRSQPAGLDQAQWFNQRLSSRLKTCLFKLGTMTPTSWAMLCSTLGFYFIYQ